MDLLLYITDKCNFFCDYCLGRKYIYQNKHTIAKRCLATLCTLMANDPGYFRSINFDSGEPLLAWDEISYLVRSLRQVRLYPRYTILTNGILLNAAKISFCQKNKINLRISFRAPLKVFAANRGQLPPGQVLKKYRQILNNLGLCQRASVPFGINFVVSPNILKALSFSYQYLAENFPADIYLIPECGILWRNKDLLDLSNELQKINNYIRARLTRANYQRTLAYLSTLVTDLNMQIYPSFRNDFLVLNQDGNIFNDEDFLYHQATPLANILELKKLSQIKKLKSPRGTPHIQFVNNTVGANNTKAFQLLIANWKKLRSRLIG